LLLSTQVTLRLHITSGHTEDHPPRPRPRPGRPRPRPAGSRPRPRHQKSGFDWSRDQNQVSRPTSLQYETIPNISNGTIFDLD